MENNNKIECAITNNQEAIDYHTKGARKGQSIMLAFFTILIILFVFRVTIEVHEAREIKDKRVVLDSFEKISNQQVAVKKAKDKSDFIAMEIMDRTGPANNDKFLAFRNQVGGVEDVLPAARKYYPYLIPEGTAGDRGISNMYDAILYSAGPLFNVINCSKFNLPAIERARFEVRGMHSTITSVKSFLDLSDSDLLKRACSTTYSDVQNAIETIRESTKTTCTVTLLSAMYELNVAKKEFLKTAPPEHIDVTDNWTDGEIKNLVNWEDCSVSVPLLKEEIQKKTIILLEDAVKKIREIISRVSYEQEKRISELEELKIQAKISLDKEEEKLASLAITDTPTETTKLTDILDQTWIYILFSAVALLGVQAGFQISRSHNFEIVDIQRKLSFLSELDFILDKTGPNYIDLKETFIMRELNPFSANLKGSEIKSPMVRLMADLRTTIEENLPKSTQHSVTPNDAKKNPEKEA